MPETINIKGISKPRLLAALFNASKQQGMGFLDTSGENQMTVEDAASVLDTWGDKLYFDYLRGRVMKVDLTGDELRPQLYDRDNGLGACQRAVNQAR